MPVNYQDELAIAYLAAVSAAQSEEEAKVADYRTFYSGEQGVVLSDRQQEYLTGRGDAIDVESWANICKRVVSIIKDRLSLTPDGISATEKTMTQYADAVTAWWNANNLEEVQKDIYEAALRDGSVAVIVGWNGEYPTYTPNLIYDGTTGLIRCHYDSDGNYIFASKRWHPWDMGKLVVSADIRLNVYRPEQIRRYISGAGDYTTWRLMDAQEVAVESNGLVTTNPQAWVDLAGSPLGIPVIPFDNPSGSELADVMVAQKGINHGMGAFDEAVDLHNNPILCVSGMTFERDDNAKKIIPTFGPATVISTDVDGGVTRVDPPDLERMFRVGVLSWVDMVALIKGWPLFLLNRSQQPPSGIALRVMEGELLAQVVDTQTAFSGAWKRAFAMGRRIYESQTGKKLPGEIALEWEPAETADPAGEIEAQVKRWEGGNIPILQRWRELGYTEEQIAQMLADQSQEQVGQMATLAAAMMEQQRRFDQGDVNV